MPTSPFAIYSYASTPPRGGGTQADLTIACQSMQMQKAWGSAPGTAVVTYVGNNVPVTAGASMRLECGGHVLYGVCVLDTTLKSSGGNTRTLEFEDNRTFLKYDPVFGSFNKRDDRIVGGVRVRRYAHILPADYGANKKTYTNAPLTAAQILNHVFDAPTVETDWVRAYHVDQTVFPVLDVDCMSGPNLQSVVQDITTRQGLVFTLTGGPYRLVWTRKGVGTLAIPANADNIKVSTALSGNPSRVRVIGDRNLYQVMDVPLIKDWSAAWEAFPVFEVFADDLYRRGVDQRTGLRFNATPADPEQYIGRQLANARALTITVREYVAARTAIPLAGDSGTAAAFADTKLFAGRSRMDMPAALYIKSLLYRAFRPNLASFTNADGQAVPLDSVELVDRLLTKVTHHPLTGAMTADASEIAEGNGYAIVKGFQIGQDLFRTIRSDQFKLDFFSSTNAVWEHVPFQIDDGGDGGGYLIFDDPVVVSPDLLADVDGYKVINAAFTLQVPQVKATLVFRAERYHYALGSPGRDLVENVPGLQGEFIVSGAVLTELPFADGQYADDKADDIASVLLAQQYYYSGGGYDVRGSNGTQLTPLIDRVQLNFGPRGNAETVDFTNERGPNAFQPERDLDRRAQEQALLPGQADLKEQAHYAELLAAGFKQNPKFGKSLSDLFGGPVEGDTPTTGVMVKNGTSTPVPVGTPLKRKSPVVATGTLSTDTLAILPAAALSTDKIFAGVTVRHNERTDRPLRVQTSGVGLARVQGPVSANDSIGLGSGTEDYFITSPTTPVGRVLQEDAGAGVKLMRVEFGGGGGGASSDARWS